MSRKRGKKQRAVVAAIPEDILAEGSGPVAADAIQRMADFRHEFISQSRALGVIPIRSLGDFQFSRG